MKKLIAFLFLVYSSTMLAHAPRYLYECQENWPVNTPERFKFILHDENQPEATNFSYETSRGTFSNPHRLEAEYLVTGDLKIFVPRESPSHFARTIRLSQGSIVEAQVIFVDSDGRAFESSYACDVRELE